MSVPLARSKSREPAAAAAFELSDLTPREIEIFEQLASHKSSKEVALALGIRADSVNKHIAAVRAKWNAVDRNDAIRRFEALRAAEDAGAPAPPQNLGAQFLPGDSDAPASPELSADLPASGEFHLSDAFTFGRDDWVEAPAPKGLEALDGWFGKAWRIAAIPIIALFFGMVLIWGLALAKELSDLF